MKLRIVHDCKKRTESVEAEQQEFPAKPELPDALRMEEDERTVGGHAAVWTALG